MTKTELRRLEDQALIARAKYEEASQLWHHVRGVVDQTNKAWHLAVARRDAAKKQMAGHKSVRRVRKPSTQQP